MKRQLKTIVLMCSILLSTAAMAQENDINEKNHIETVFKNDTRSVRGYGALTNKFTTLGGEYANLVGAYGGVYINHKFLIGIGAAALTNNLSVPLQYSTDPLRNMSYEYGQVGLVTEYVLGSNKAFHIAFNLFSGAGFTLQHERYDWHNHDDDFDFDDDEVNDENWFFVAEPGVQFEINVFKWMRFSPGISYRAAFGSDGLGMKDSDISNLSYNATLKFGGF
ncbi:hypothetical protein [Chryseolinea sp. H1M3-3]|uniref:hypothetical protein n=1 Tax=Chryseolinea sp. H1M3-3 TaxID=3034144 RepID=UPI0023ED8FE9|nr:hypothetical protein [Chryseolinea sp. H1M3-3]